MNAMQNVNGMKLPKDGYCTVMLNWHLQCSSVTLLRDEEGVERASDLLRMRCASLVDNKPILPAQSIQSSKLCNISNVLLGCKASFTNTIQSLERFGRPLENEHSVRAVDMGITEIVEDMMSWKVLVASSGAIYVRYIEEGIIMIKYREVPLFLGKLERDVPAAKIFALRTLKTKASTLVLTSISSS